MSRSDVTVFLVDDDQNFLQVATHILTDAGYLTLGARDGEEALSRMRGSFGPRIAIVDLAMPRMSGWELIGRMKQDASLRGIAVVVTSALQSDVQTGAIRLMKPFSARAMLETVSIAAIAARTAARFRERVH